jgi:hypothetical protein
MHPIMLNLILDVVFSVAITAIVWFVLRQIGRDRLRSKIMRSEHRLGIPPAQRSNLDYLMPRPPQESPAMSTYRRFGRLLAAAAVATALVGCQVPPCAICSQTPSAPARHRVVPALGSACPAWNTCTSARAAALAYIKSHPVPARRGMVAGIVLSETADTSPTTYTWTQTMITTSGATITITCGSAAAKRPCTWRDPGPEMGAVCTGGPGTYQYFRADGDASSFGDVHVIKYGALC